jgi:hypothetical protein
MLQAYLFSDEFWGRFAGDQGCRYHNVYFSALFKKEFHFGLNEFFGHLFCISTSTRSILLDFNFNKFSAKRLNLFTNCRSCIKTSGDCSETACLGVVKSGTRRRY